jgi:hypothetical protein
MCISSGGLSLFFSRASGRKVSGSARAAHAGSVGRWAAAATCLQRRLDLVTHNETDVAHSSASDQPLDAIEPLQAYVYLALTYGTATSWAPVHQPLWPFSSPCSWRYHQPHCHGVCVAKCPQPDISLYSTRREASRWRSVNGLTEQPIPIRTECLGPDWAASELAPRCLALQDRASLRPVHDCMPSLSPTDSHQRV